ncbi:MAG: FixH family protein [Nitrospirae bacterium]|nr:FixH family protein [Nitrospirota bacterium]
MKNCVVWVVSLLFMAGASYAADGVMKQKVEDYTVAVAFEKMPPSVGDNMLTITVTDPAGKTVTNPVVKLRAHMEELKITEKVKTMGYMTAPVDLKHEGAACVSTVDFTMPGRWVVDMKVKTDGKFITTSFHVKVK